MLVLMKGKPHIGPVGRSAEETDAQEVKMWCAGLRVPWEASRREMLVFPVSGTISQRWSSFAYISYLVEESEKDVPDQDQQVQRPVGSVGQREIPKMLSLSSFYCPSLSFSSGLA